MFNRKTTNRLLSFCLAACLLLGAAGCGSAGSSGSGKRVVAGKTPEETLETFCKALSRQDVNTMMACCYIEDYFDCMSFAQFTDRMHAYQPYTGISAPTEYDYYRDILLYQRCANFARQFQLLTFSLLATGLDEYEQLVGNQPIGGVDGEWAAEFSRAVDPKTLAGLKVRSIDEDCPERQSDPQYKESMRKNSGAGDCVERTVLLELDGTLFYKGFTLAEVDGRWQIHMLNALLLGDSPYGTATQVESAEEYHDIIQ